MPDQSVQHEDVQGKDDTQALFDMAPDFASVCMSQTQTEASTVCFDMRSGPMKFADSKTITKSLGRASSHDCSRAAKGCEEVAWLALEQTNRAAIGSEQGVEILLSCLQRWMGKKAGILMSCLTALSRLLSLEQNVAAFYDFESPLLKQMEKERRYLGGGTILVAAAMSGYPLKTDMQMHGCAVAKVLAGDALTSQRFLDNGMVGHVLAALHRHSDSAALCSEGITTFLQLLGDDEEDAAKNTQKRICSWLVHDGVVLDYIAEALQTHVHHSEVSGLAVQFILQIQEYPELLLEVRKSTVVATMLECCEIHGANGELSHMLVSALLPHPAEYPSRLDEFARCVKKVMSCNADAELLSLCCILAAKIGAACPNDATKLRLSKHMVPYVSAALDTFNHDNIVALCATKALRALVINKWDTDLGKPRKLKRPTQKQTATHTDPIVVE